MGTYAPPPPPQGWSTYINYLEFFCMGYLPVLPIFKCIKSFIYIRMDS